MSEREAGGKTPAGGGRPAQDRGAARDKRKADGTAKAKSRTTPASEPAEATPTGSGTPSDPAPETATAQPAGTETAKPETAKPETAKPETAKPETVKPEATIEEPETAEPEAEPAGTAAVAEPAGAGPGDDAATTLSPLNAELEAMRSELDERLRDLQRVTAEYANYRKRVDRDRMLVVEQATGAVLATLLPILDDLDRARDHGDLVGPFGAVAEHLIAALGKFGLTPFGEKGDPFDPTRHEAVAHQTSADVEEPTCVEVMRRGYLLGDRLLRPALVAVADPE